MISQCISLIRTNCMQMQSRVEKLLEASDEFETYFLAYTRARAKGLNNTPIFVFEGIDDPKYYSSRISYRFGHNWIALSVRGKSTVKELRESIQRNSSYCKDKVGYFIDKDFDDDSTSVDTYVTPCYSIENFYTHEEAVKQLLVSSAGLSQNSEEHNEVIDWVLDKYTTYKKEYSSNKKTKRLNLAFLYIRKVLHDKLIKLDSLFTISHSISHTYTLTITAKQKFIEILPNFDYCEFIQFIRNDSTARLIRQAKTDFYRGKQELSFLKEFITSIKSEGKPSNKSLNKLLKEEKGYSLIFKNTAIGNDLLSDLSSVASTPRCLTNFLDALSLRFN